MSALGYIKIRGYNGTTQEGEDPGAFEVFQGIGGGFDGGGGDGDEGSSLTSILQEISNKIGTNANPDAETPASATLSQGLGDIKASIDELEGELITISAELAGMLTAYGVHALVEETNWGLLLTALASYTTLLGTIEVTLAELAATHEQVEDHLDTGLTRTENLQEVSLIQDMINVLKAGLTYEQSELPNKPLISWLSEIVDKLEALEFNDQEIDLGPIRIWLRSRIIEY